MRRNWCSNPPNHVRLFYSKDDQGLARVTPKQLLESCLRMKPDRILLAELRAEEAFDYLRNVNSGHPGSITSIHAGSCELAFEQLVLLVKQSRRRTGARAHGHQESSCICWSMSSSSSASSGTNASSRKSGMNPSAGVAAWRKPAKPGSRRLAQSGAGRRSRARCSRATSPGSSFCGRCTSIRVRATPLTVAQYGYYYAERPEVRQRLLGSVRCGLGPWSRQSWRVPAAAPPCAAWRCALCHARGDRRGGAPRAKTGSSWADRAALSDARRPAGRGARCAAARRKGTGVVVPNALNWPGSLVCVDIKRENWTHHRRLSAPLGPGVLSL